MYEIAKPLTPQERLLAALSEGNMPVPQRAPLRSAIGRPLVSEDQAPGMFGMRAASPTDSKQLVDSIVAQEMRAPVQHWSQAVMRPLLGLVKTGKDSAARDYDTQEKADKANQLATAIAGIRGGMDAQGDVDLSNILAGISDPAMIAELAAYADKQGNSRYDRYDGNRKFERGNFESDRTYGAGREDEQFDRTVADRNYEADRDNEGYRRADTDRKYEQDVATDNRDYSAREDQRQFEQKQSQIKLQHEAEAHAQKIRESRAPGETKAVIGPDGQPTFIQLDQDGKPVQTPGGYKPIASEVYGSEANRKPTPAELAANDQTRVARNIVKQMIAEQGIEAVMDPFNEVAKGYVEAAKRRMVGADDPDFEAISQILSGVNPNLLNPPAPSVADAIVGTPAPAPGGIPAPKSKAEFDALPSGTRFTAPDGTVRVKP